MKPHEANAYAHVCGTALGAVLPRNRQRLYKSSARRKGGHTHPAGSRATARHIWPASLPQIWFFRLASSDPNARIFLASLSNPTAADAHPWPWIWPRVIIIIPSAPETEILRFIPNLKAGWPMAYHHQLQHASLFNQRVRWRSRGQQTRLAAPQQGSLIRRLK